MTGDESLEIQGCQLDASGVSAQRTRYRRLAEDVSEITRTEASVVVSFRPSVDRDLLAETLEVERACCPFFVFALDDPRRRLKISVQRADQVPALDALASALSRGG